MKQFQYFTQVDGQRMKFGVAQETHEHVAIPITIEDYSAVLGTFQVFERRRYQ